MEDNIFDKVHEVDLEKTMEDFLHRLCHERYRFTSTTGCQRRSETSSASCTVFHDRVKQRTGQAAS